MSGDVTIPCEMAADIAKALRNVAESWKPLGRSLAVERLSEWADLLDPPPPSLRDEVASVLVRADWSEALCHTDAVLAVVRKRVADLRHQWGGDGWIVRYDDVLQLLGGGDE